MAKFIKHRVAYSELGKSSCCTFGLMKQKKLSRLVLFVILSYPHSLFYLLAQDMKHLYWYELTEHVRNRKCVQPFRCNNFHHLWIVATTSKHITETGISDKEFLICHAKSISLVVNNENVNWPLVLSFIFHMQASAPL